MLCNGPRLKSKPTTWSSEMSNKIKYQTSRTPPESSETVSIQEL